MKRFYLLLFVLVASHWPARAQWHDHIDQIARSEAGRAALSVSQRSDKEEEFATYDIHHVAAHWHIDPAERYISGEVHISFSALQDGVSEITLAMQEALQIKRLFYDGERADQFGRRNANIIYVPLPEPLDAGETGELVIVYEGEPVNDGFGSFAHAWRKPDTSNTDSIPVLWTLSQPDGAKNWWPCKNTLDDKIDSVDIYIYTPSQFLAASNGVLESQLAVDDSTTCYHWKHRYPIEPYLVAFAVTEYEEYVQHFAYDGDTFDIVNYYYAEDSTVFFSQIEGTITAMQVFSDLFGSYPFKKEKYGHAQFSWRGGMEHQTMSFMYNFNWDLLTHELAHQWFGDKVTCASWRDIWLNEGFATYLTGLSYDYTGSRFWYNWRFFARKSILNNTRSGSVYIRNDTLSVGRIFNAFLTYRKGAYLLHMLRWHVGDEAFFEGMHNYINDTALAYRYSTTPIFQGHMEAAHGESLDWFFDDWLYGQGYPEYRTVWRQNSDNLLEIKLKQIPTHESIDFFELDIPFKVKNGERDTIIIIPHRQDKDTFTIQMDFAADSVVFDPDLWLLANELSNKRLRFFNEDEFITLHPNPTNRFLFLQTRADFLNVNEIFISDLNGRKLLEFPVSMESQFDFVRMEVATLPVGTYTVTVVAEVGSFSKKFIKH